MAIMSRPLSVTLPRVLTFLAVLLLIKTVAAVVLDYRHYFPPDFGSTFLQGREAYFWGPYSWAFFTHVIFGPASLVLGTVLLSDRFRATFPLWHRRLGRVQVACVLLLVTPSGLWMARYAETGAQRMINRSRPPLTGVHVTMANNAARAAVPCRTAAHQDGRGGSVGLPPLLSGQAMRWQRRSRLLGLGRSRSIECNVDVPNGHAFYHAIEPKQV
jgi:hypothetical protein